MILGDVGMDKLIGGVIEGIIEDPDNDEYAHWQGLQVRLADGQLVNAWIDRDKEGNGPGCLNLDLVEEGKDMDE